jgi:hypothetical protein
MAGTSQWLPALRAKYWEPDLDMVVRAWQGFIAFHLVAVKRTWL